MEVYPLSQTFARVPTVCALGLFDGVHLGHRALLDLTVHTAKARGLTPAVLTFSDGDFKTGNKLTTQAARLRLFEEIGIERVYLMDFAAVRGLSPDDFVEKLLVERCGARVAVCGFNYHYGLKAVGNVDTLAASMQKTAGEVFVLPAATTEDGEVISSTRIRRAIESGEIGPANAMLGRPYRLTATVVHGQGLGHTLGLATINQRFEEDAVIPARGVYATRCLVDGVGYAAITNVGVRPTVGGTELLAESHLLDFAGDLYGKEVACDFLRMIREERTFDSLEALVAQIKQDIDSIREER